MDICLNDFSLSGNIDLKDNWQIISRFGFLMSELKSFGIDKAIFPKGFKKMSIGGFQWEECYVPTCSLSVDQRRELMALMNNSIREIENDESVVGYCFSESDDFSRSSVLVANAYASDSSW